MLTDFTTYAEVRAVLGVAEDELEDVTLSMPLYEKLLGLDLEDVGTGLTAQYFVVKAIAAGSRTSAQVLFFDLAQLFSAYAVAKHLLVSLPYFSEFRIKDGRAEMQRQQDPFELTEEGVIAGFNDLRLRLSAAYTGLVGGNTLTRTVRTLTLSTGLAVDPVTNA